jgi:hypothetical protein
MNFSTVLHALPHSIYSACESSILIGLTTSNAQQVRLVGMVHRADTLDDTRRVVQRCCA